MDFLRISCIAVFSSGSSCVLNTCMRLTAVIPPLASVTVTSDQTATLEAQAQVHSSGNFSALSSYRNAAGKTYSCPISVSKSAHSRIFFPFHCQKHMLTLKGKTARVLMSAVKLPTGLNFNVRTYP